jgi:hypothetical protein
LAILNRAVLGVIMPANPSIRDRGLPEQKAMCEFLGAAPSASPQFDFIRAGIRFEYKWSNAHPAHPGLVRAGKESERHVWTWADIWGDSNAKSFDYLLLEGGTPSGGSETFLIPKSDIDELANREAKKRNTFEVQTKESKRGGPLHQFVWSHRCGKHEIRSRLDQFENGGSVAQPRPTQYSLFMNR